VNLGTLICYEALFPHLVRDLVRRGADLLVNISNDSWLDSGDGAAPRQHLSMVVFRAIETRRYVVRASASGVSGFITPLGELYSLVPSDRAGAAVASVVPLHGSTAYVRWGDAWILLGGLCTAAVLARRREAIAS
jgi:apolipoprotein N-acyltransferase